MTTPKIPETTEEKLEILAKVVENLFLRLLDGLYQGDLAFFKSNMTPEALDVFERWAGWRVEQAKAEGWAT